MQIALQITFRDMEPSPALEERIEAAAAKLEAHAPRLTSCRVVVQAPHKHHQHGRLFHVTIDLTLPGKEIVVGRTPTERHEHEDAHVAVRDAFRAARRAVEDHERRRREQARAAEEELRRAS
jgi:ribosome-associated translation inhibitor RaiA